MGNVYKALNSLLTTTASVTRASADLAVGAIYDSYKLGSTIVDKAVMKRKGTYAENLMQGNLLPVKLKPIVGASIVAGIGAYGIGDGVVNYNNVNTKGMEANQNVTGVLSQQGSPVRKVPIDTMGASGDMVLAIHNKGR
jgi:hypothetical protein